MDFGPMKILFLGAALGFIQTALGILRKEDWGKLDFCEYLLQLLKQIHVLTICLLGYALISAALFTILNSVAYTALLLNQSAPGVKYFLVLLAGYVPTKALSWLTLVKRVKLPLSGVDALILRWREIFIEQLREEFKLRLIKLHCDLSDSDEVMKKKLYLFYEQYKDCIARDLKSDKARRLHPEDYALLTRYLVEWQGYYSTARMLGKKGFWFDRRQALCPLGTLTILGLLIYLLYHFGFFAIAHT
jgi:hypothetical protein